MTKENSCRWGRPGITLRELSWRTLPAPYVCASYQYKGSVGGIWYMGNIPSKFLHDLPYPIRDFLIHRAILRVVGISEPGAAEFLLDEVEGWREDS